MAGELQQTLRLLHIVGVAFLLGGLGTQALWKALADRTRDVRQIAAVHDKLLRVDRIVTGPSALLVFVTGYVTIRGLMGASIGGSPWALWGLILLFVSLALWYFGLRPLEIKMADAADAAAASGRGLGVEHARWSGTWFLVWSLVILLILVVAGLMVFKPGGTA